MSYGLASVEHEKPVRAGAARSSSEDASSSDDTTAPSPDTTKLRTHAHTQSKSHHGVHELLADDIFPADN